MGNEQGKTGEQRVWQIQADYPFGWDPADDQSPTLVEENEEIDGYDTSDLYAAERRLRQARRLEVECDPHDLRMRRQAVGKALHIIANATHIVALRDSLVDICRDLKIESISAPSRLAIVDEAFATALLLVDSRVMNSQSIYPIRAGHAVYQELQSLSKSVMRDEALMALMEAMTQKLMWDRDEQVRKQITVDAVVRQRLTLAPDLPYPARAIQFFRAHDDLVRCSGSFPDEFLMSLPIVRMASELAAAPIPEYESDIYEKCMWSLENRLAAFGSRLGHDSVVELDAVFHDVLRAVVNAAGDPGADLGVAYNCYTSFLDGLAALGEFGLAVNSLEEHGDFFTAVMDVIRKEVGGAPASAGYPPSDLPLLLAIAKAFSPTQNPKRIQPE